jgi:DNA-binding protein YbaB
MLEDLVAAAVNDAVTKARIESETEMNKITNGINMPGVF